MSPNTIITILSILETVAETSLKLYSNYKQVQNIDPSSVVLEDEKRLADALQKTIELRMEIRQKLIDELESEQSNTDTES